MKRIDGLEKNMKGIVDHMSTNNKRLNTIENNTARIEDLETSTKRLDDLEEN